MPVISHRQIDPQYVSHFPLVHLLRHLQHLRHLASLQHYRGNMFQMRTQILYLLPPFNSRTGIPLKPPPSTRLFPHATQGDKHINASFEPPPNTFPRSRWRNHLMNDKIILNERSIQFTSTFPKSDQQQMHIKYHSYHILQNQFIVTNALSTPQILLTHSDSRREFLTEFIILFFYLVHRAQHRLLLHVMLLAFRLELLPQVLQLVLSHTDAGESYLLSLESQTDLHYLVLVLGLEGVLRLFVVLTECAELNLDQLGGLVGCLSLELSLPQLILGIHKRRLNLLPFGQTLFIFLVNLRGGLMFLRLELGDLFTQFNRLSEISKIRPELQTACLLLNFIPQQLVLDSSKLKLPFLNILHCPIKLKPQLFIPDPRILNFLLTPLKFLPCHHLLHRLLQPLLRSLKGLVVFLREHVNLLRTVIDLTAALIELTLQGDVLHLQLPVLLLQQRHPLLVL